ncbi:hypothetical protein AUF78_09460 [archaeon 13_1_20CM_2_51_12]|nr:MAG: hypothetical protein AUI97_04335 [Crenarchaeota archaeon 13_1_40CM_3_52_17]OLE69808.1 MAG: hypothetical protein AUF78_09460 [archaeon 13_1_20CM_2_51_12]
MEPQNLRFEPDYIPRILLSMIFFGLGSSLQLATLAAPSCLCPLMIVGQPSPPLQPPTYLIWGIMIALLLIGAGIIVLVLPRDKPTKRTESPASDLIGTAK